MKKTALSITESYMAMQIFLEKYYELTGSNDVGSLLGSMELSDDGKTMDPALWNDWLKAVDNVLKKPKI